MGAACAAADVIVACTAAPRAVVTAAMLAGAPPRARVFVDLGVPRNVHEDVRALPDTRVLDVDALRFWSGAGEGVDARAAEHGRAAAEREVERWVARFADLAARAGARTDHPPPAGGGRARARRGDGPRARAPGVAIAARGGIVRAMSARLVNKLLHHPLVALATAPESAEWWTRRAACSATPTCAPTRTGAP
jgi:glutamyl-tRNA reductase